MTIRILLPFKNGKDYLQSYTVRKISNFEILKLQKFNESIVCLNFSTHFMVNFNINVLKAIKLALHKSTYAIKFSLVPGFSPNKFRISPQYSI